jgi:hypothetical protein
VETKRSTLANHRLRLAIILAVYGASWFYLACSNDTFEGPYPFFNYASPGGTIASVCMLATIAFWIYTLGRLIRAAAHQPERSGWTRAIGGLTWAAISLVSCGMNLSNTPTTLPGTDPLSRANGDCWVASARIGDYMAKHGGQAPATPQDLHAIWAEWAATDAHHPYSDHTEYYPAEPVLEADIPATAPTREAAEAKPGTPLVPTNSLFRGSRLYYARIVPSNGLTWRGFALGWGRAAAAQAYVVGSYDWMGRPWLAAIGPLER